MKHLKKISNFFGKRKEEFNDFLFDIMDVASVRIDYGCYDEKILHIFDIASDPSELKKNIPSSCDHYTHGIIISIEFLDIKSIEKTSEFYNCLLECVERFSEKYGEDFKYRDFKHFFLSSKIKQNECTMVGYIFFIKN